MVAQPFQNAASSSEIAVGMISFLSAPGTSSDDLYVYFHMSAVVFGIATTCSVFRIRRDTEIQFLYLLIAFSSLLI